MVLVLNLDQIAMYSQPDTVATGRSFANASRCDAINNATSKLAFQARRRATMNAQATNQLQVPRHRMIALWQADLAYRQIAVRPLSRIRGFETHGKASWLKGFDAGGRGNFALVVQKTRT